MTHPRPTDAALGLEPVTAHAREGRAEALATTTGDGSGHRATVIEHRDSARDACPRCDVHRAGAVTTAGTCPEVIIPS